MLSDHYSGSKGYHGRGQSPGTSVRDRQAADLFHPTVRKRSPVQLMQPPSLGPQGATIANQLLQELAQLLKLDALKFDNKNTCEIDYGGKCTLLITYDPPTERMYVYSTLLSSLPGDMDAKLALYEYLLEGALLGRDMAGGGVGISTKDNMALMCTSFDVRNSEADALRAVVPSFVASLLEWRQRVQRHIAAVTDDNVPINSHHQQVDSKDYGSGAPPHGIVSPLRGPTPTTSISASASSKALLIGINYFGTGAELRHSSEDVQKLRTFLFHNGFDDAQNFVVLTDDEGSDPASRPTKQNILNGLQWLISDIRPGDSLFLAFCGHIRREEDLAVDEHGKPLIRHALCPVDYQAHGTISDSEVYDRIVPHLPEKTALNIIIDGCGALVDMGMAHKYVGEPTTENDQAPHTHQNRNARRNLPRCNPNATVHLLSCAYDAAAAGRLDSRFLEAYIRTLTRQPVQHYSTLVHSLRQLLQSGSYQHSSWPSLFSPLPMALSTDYAL